MDSQTPRYVLLYWLEAKCPCRQSSMQTNHQSGQSSKWTINRSDDKLKENYSQQMTAFHLLHISYSWVKIKIPRLPSRTDYLLTPNSIRLSWAVPICLPVRKVLIT